MTDVTLAIAGQAGQGIDTGSELLARAWVRSGYHTFAYPNLMSRIRGGHNFTAVRVSDRPVYSVAARFNALLALDELSVEEHRRDLEEGGTIVAELRTSNGGRSTTDDGQADGRTTFRVPMADIARKQGGAKARANVVGLGALLALTGHSADELHRLLKERFRAKGDEVVRQNLACCRAGAEYVRREFSRTCACTLPQQSRQKRRLCLTGNHAIALGALASGVRFYAGYPMSPSTPIMEYLAVKQAEAGLVVEQVEDEIAAINAVLGASYAGARAMTATSGGGFSLMVEGLGFAGMAELPVVIVIAMRPGPATGFPTRTEQAELLFAISASQDEFPRFVFAPGTAEEAFYATNRAFELAGRFQAPAIVLSDQLLSDSLWTVPGFNLARVKCSEDWSDGVWRDRPAYTYQRYALTPSGVSPMVRPGVERQLVRVLGAEHDQQGFQTEDADVRKRMHEKRMRKLPEMSRTLEGPTWYGDEAAEWVAVCFGSTYGAMREAIDLLRTERRSVAMLHLCELAPFPRAQVEAKLGSRRGVVAVEANSTGQLAALLRRETGLKPAAQVLKYDGRPFQAEALAAELKGICT
ncbi:2-oxoacid:acceptor oxidoreductase subunit alpha [candidate division WOR-3 bacterium]|nr:2-oxoacid:acceptor oxidoreductase subunit alpha [candidate division WOR-3 bacterium]